MGAALTVYKASAGSGKTFTLTSEYVALLLSGEPSAHRNILAVTFTNKATAEMKARILEELWDIANGTTETGFLRAVMSHLEGVGVTTVRQRARAALHAIVHDYDYFSIKTIDSFFQSLLSTLAHELGLAATFRVEINDGQVIGEAVDKLLKSLDSKPQLVTKLLHYIQERIDDNRDWDFTKEVKRLASLIMKDKFMENEDDLMPILEDEDGMRCYRQELHRMAAEARSTIEEAVADFRATIESLGDPKRFSHYNYVESYLKNLTKEVDKLQTKAVKERIDDPDKWIKAADKKAGRYSDEAVILSQALEDLENVHLTALSVINSCELTTAFLNPLQIIGDIDGKVREINEANNRFMLAKTPLLFDKMVKGEDASFVFEKAGTTYHHIMIDEFQDTSPIQWRNFYRLLLENMAQGNSCLLVGDVKQGIYRFRGGDWKILSSFETSAGRHPVDIKTLSTNFRSAQNIIDFNNMVFREIAAAIKDATADGELADIYADVEQKPNGRGGGYVEIRFDVTKKKDEGKQAAPPAEDDEEDENAGDVAQQLAEKIKELHAAGVAYGSMAILVRRNKEISSLLETFLTKYADIPLLSDEAFHLSSSTAVLTIIYALKAITTGARLQKPDAVSLAYLAHAYSRSLGDDEAGNNAEMHPEDVIPEEFLQQIEQLAQVPLYALCEKIINIFSLMDGEQQSPYIYFFLDEVLNYLESGSTELTDFLDYWDASLRQKTIPASKINGVRVLTIHKAKGLAYDTVFMPYCNWPYQGGGNDLYWCEPPMAPYNYLPLLPIKFSSKMEHSVYSEIYERDRKDTRTENINMMYVAFTRARTNLYVWAKAKEGANIAAYGARMGDYLYHVLQKEDYAYGASPTEAAEEKQVAEAKAAAPSQNPLTAEVVPEYVLPVSYPLHAEFLQSNSAGEFIADGDTEDKAKSYIDQGKLLHSVFSKIRTAADVDNAVGELWITGKLSDKAEADRLRAFITKSLEAPLPKDWFSGEWVVCNERNILSRDADGSMHVRRPDRVMTKGKKMVVVDFKFGTARKEHEQQVAEYCQLLRKMGCPDVKGYLWYVFTNAITEVES